MKAIQKAAVIGSGTMGSGIAAHLANAGVPCVLLDLVPDGVDAKAPASERSRLALEAIQRQSKVKPAGLFSPSRAHLIEAGNLEDDLEKLRDCDWIIEAVTERIEIKQDLYAKIAPFRREDAIVSSNTSGISLSILTEKVDASFAEHFLITHFFNPPRYLYLLELVPGPKTLDEVYDTIARFAGETLGKGVVRCKDTPNFIGNRIGVYSMANCAHLTEEMGLSFEEVDAITGRLMGRPKTASFSLQDLVGIDISCFVMENVVKLLPDDESKDVFRPPEIFKKLVDAGRLGRKSGAGFYKKEGKEILVLDRDSFEYRSQKKVEFESIAEARQEKEVGPRIKKLLEGSDSAAEFAWKHLAGTLAYSARRIPEIADDIVAVDRAIRWGFNWDLGPFEIWDAIGVRSSVERMKKDGIDVPDWVTSMLESGRESFYGHDGERFTHFEISTGKEAPVPERDGVLLLSDVRAASKPVLTSPGASLWDIGDGVLCVEYHSKMNTISSDTLNLIVESVDVVEKGDYRGLVIGNQGPHFSAGANIQMLVEAALEGNFGAIDEMIRAFHRTAMRIRYSTRPVVVATQGLSLGGGCEIPLAAHRIQASAETYMGLVELGVGLIPAGGGTRELACRAHESVPENLEADIFPYIKRAFQTVAMGTVSSCAPEARDLGFLKETDGISMNRDRALADARRVVTHLSECGFRAPPRRDAVRVVGSPGFAELKILIHQYREGGHISPYDAHLATQLAYVLCGGEVDDDARVSEEYLLDLEREVFIELCKQPKTHERIGHTLKTGKPLRN